MPGSGSPTDQPLPRLTETTCALELGQWWLPAIGQPVSEACTEAEAWLLSIHRVVAEGMRARAFGDVVAAWTWFQEAARLLPHRARTRAPDGGGWLVLVEPAPATTDGELWWVYCSTRVIRREQDALVGLRDLFERLVRDGADEEQLVAATVEYLGVVECDTGVWEAVGRGEAVSIERSPGNLCRRVDRLRRFAVPTAGDFRVSQWRRSGGYRGVHAKALRHCAASPLVEWAQGERAQEVPVRRGRELLWNFARGMYPA
jgi:hypothetical protein